MNDWKEYRLSDFVDINPKVALSRQQEHSFIEMKDLSNDLKFANPSRMRIPKGGARFIENDVLFARITPCLENGKIGVARNLKGGKGFGSTEFLVFRSKKEISDSDFVYYLSRYYEVRNFAVKNMIGTSGRQRVARQAFDNLLLPLPPLPQQKRIAEILSALDEKIELNLQMNRTLEDMAKALYKHWFVKEETTKIRVDELIDFNPKLKIPKASLTSYVDMKALPTSHMSVSKVIKRPFTAGSKFQNNDTLMARITPCLENGKTAFVDFLEKDEIGFGSTEFITMRPKKDTSPYYAYCLARDKAFINYAVSIMIGSSGRQRVQLSSLVKYEVNKQPTEKMQQFHKKITLLFAQVKANVEESKSLRQTRDTLLPQLLSGKIRI